MLQSIKAFLKDEQGLETVEWAIVGALVVVAAVSVFALMGPRVTTALQGVNAGLEVAAP